MPLDDMQRHGYSLDALDEDIREGQARAGCRAAVRDLVRSTHTLFDKGKPLLGMVERQLSVDLDLFSRGGLAVLKKIEDQGFDTIRQRPKVGKIDRASLMMRAVAGSLFRRNKPYREAQHAFR